MESIFLIIMAIVAFVATNVDDLFVLMIFFANPNFKIKQVVLGQYIGVLSLIMISALGYFFKLVIPSVWIGMLGIFPIIIGLKNLRSLRSNNNSIQNLCEIDKNKRIFLKFMNPKTFSVAFVSFCNGGDNIGVYTPLFASINIYQMISTILIFLVMIGIWCFVSFHR